MIEKNVYETQTSFNRFMLQHPELVNVEMTEIYADWRNEEHILVKDPELASLLLESAEAIKDMDPNVFKTLVELEQ